MKIEQRVWTRAKGWSLRNGPDTQVKFQLVILFAETGILKEKTFFEEVKQMYPGGASLRVFHLR